MTNITANDIRQAAGRIAPYTHRTPVLSSEWINRISGRQIHFKCENFQKAGAFKSRGACNVVFSLSDAAARKGVATHSSGNHAAALARAAALRGFPAHIVMPENAPKIKIAAVKSYGGMIRFCKPTLEAREQTLLEIIAESGAMEIHPYNNEGIICGQATAAKELIESLDEKPDVILAPVGGGGLLSGTALSAHYFGGIPVIACEPLGADDAYQSFHSKKFVPSQNPKTIADGLLTSLGSITYPLIMKYVEDIVRVEEESIIKAMRMIWERMKIIVEPSSAVPLAAVLEEKIPQKYQKIAIILSGGNQDLNNLPW